MPNPPTSSDPTQKSPSPAAEPQTERSGKSATELQREAPPPGQDQQPPTDPAGEPQLA